LVKVILQRGISLYLSGFLLLVLALVTIFFLVVTSCAIWRHVRSIRRSRHESIIVTNNRALEVVVFPDGSVHMLHKPDDQRIDARCQYLPIR
jgi:uncharacterized protein (DUF58 family)